MRKLLISLFVLFMLVGIASAESPLAAETKITVGFKSVDVGTFIDLKNDNQISVGATMPIIGWKELLGLNLGLLSDLNQRPTLIGTIDVNLQELATLCKLHYWLLEPLKVGVWLGNDIDNSKLTVKRYGLYGNITILF